MNIIKNNKINIKSMVRLENELIDSLMNLLGKKTQKKTLTDKELSDIEKYRDEEGFINVTNIKDFDEMKYIIDLVDKKNSLEIENEELDDFVKTLSNDLLKFAGVDKATINFETPHTTVNIVANKDEMPKYSVTKNAVDNEQKCDNEKFTKTCSCCCEPCECKDKTECCKDKTPQTLPKDLFEDDEIENVIVLHNAGGMFNAPFYNAVMHICEIEHFKDTALYSDEEVNPLSADSVILLPNVWGKIYEDVASIFGKQILEGQKVYIIDPETFELKPITDPFELWDYVMTKTQANSRL